MSIGPAPSGMNEHVQVARDVGYSARAMVCLCIRERSDRRNKGSPIVRQLPHIQPHYPTFLPHTVSRFVLNLDEPPRMRKTAKSLASFVNLN